MPEPEKTWEDLYNMPPIDLNDYLKMIESYINSQIKDRKLKWEGESYKFKAKTKAEGEVTPGDIRFLIRQLQDEARLKGVESSSLYPTIASGMMTPEWYQQQYQGALQQAQGKYQQEYQDYLKSQQREREFQWQTEMGRAELAQRQAEADRKWQMQQQELSLAQQDIERQRLNYEQGLRAAQATQRLWTLQPKQTELDAQEKARVWESARQEFMSQITGPEYHWQRAEIQNLQNPWSTTGEDDWTGKSARLQEELKDAEVLAKEAKQLEKEASQDPNRSLTFPEQQFIDIAKGRLDAVRGQLLESQLQAGRQKWGWSPSPGVTTGGNIYAQGIPTASGGLAYGGGQAPEPIKRTPETPAWLQKIYPTMGKYSTKQPMIAPSGQTWSGMLPSEQAGFRSYAMWSGWNPEDALAQMQQMLPKTPRVSGGWAPARQRI